jgi:hypothetical protein
MSPVFGTTETCRPQKIDTTAWDRRNVQKFGRAGFEQVAASLLDSLPRCEPA